MLQTGRHESTLGPGDYTQDDSATLPYGSLPGLHHPDPATKLSAAFLAPPRPNPTVPGCGSDAVYAPSVPDYDQWFSKGFSTTSGMRDICPEQWGSNVREPLDPYLTAQMCAAAPALVLWTYVDLCIQVLGWGRRPRTPASCRPHPHGD